MKYELTFLVKDDTELKNVKALVESFKGKISKEEKWGERTLAYPIDKNHTAVFYNYYIEIDKSEVLSFKNKLNLNEKVLRYLLLSKE